MTQADVIKLHTLKKVKDMKAPQKSAVSTDNLHVYLNCGFSTPWYSLLMGAVKPQDATSNLDAPEMNLLLFS